ncbi:virB8 family protein [Vibrio aerogenes]|uniref:virB8 family protein n=1 Tax=Vibrio aerogenes TaxID=92172 RepID=UPI0021C2F475|nr:type IV secretion system protein [Vibrio aerogenes]
MSETIVDAALAQTRQFAAGKPKMDHIKAAEQLLKEANAFEKDRIALAKRSERKAWMIAAISVGLAILSIVAIVIMMPLKSVDYRLLTVDKHTGIAQIVRPLADAKGETYGEALDKYWINRYIIERGSYQWETIQDSFDFTQLASSEQVFSGYNTWIRSKSSPLEVFQDHKKISLSDVSIAFLPTKKGDRMLAQVSFVKTVLNPDDTHSPEYLPTRWSATLTFDYRQEIKTQADRLLNPLGFRVTSYREDRVIE